MTHVKHVTNGLGPRIHSRLRDGGEFLVSYLRKVICSSLSTPLTASHAHPPARFLWQSYLLSAGPFVLFAFSSTFFPNLDLLSTFANMHSNIITLALCVLAVPASVTARPTVHALSQRSIEPVAQVAHPISLRRRTQRAQLQQVSCESATAAAEAGKEAAVVGKEKGAAAAEKNKEAAGNAKEVAAGEKNKEAAAGKEKNKEAAAGEGEAAAGEEAANASKSPASNHE